MEVEACLRERLVDTQNRDVLATQNLLIAACTYDRVVRKQHDRY